MTRGQQLPLGVGTIAHMAHPQPPTTLPKLYTDEELKKLFSGVAHEVQNAHIYYNLFRALRSRIRGYEREYNNSPAFWGMTMNAHLLGAISCLCRAYDQHRDGLNLRRLLEALRICANKPCGGRKLPTAKRFDRDISSVGKSDPLANKLVWQRNHIYAHLDRDNVLKGVVQQAQFTLRHAQFKRLLDRAERIINHYGQVFMCNTWLMKIVGDGDYMQVLRALKECRLSYERKIREEEAEINREARRTAKRKKGKI